MKEFVMYTGCTTPVRLPAYEASIKVVLEKLVENLDEGSFSVDRNAQMEGRFMSMLLAPKARKS